MTYVYQCGKCAPRFSDQGVIVEGNWGMKQSCCHKCSNPECSDYGECDCFEELFQQLQEMRQKMIEDGTHPLLSSLDEEE